MRTGGVIASEQYVAAAQVAVHNARLERTKTFFLKSISE
jgi:hypothetical protein